MRELAIEKELLNNGVPWDALQKMDRVDVLKRYMVWTLPFLQKSLF